jgi:serine/threonine protein phosphatase PrpC
MGKEREPAVTVERVETSGAENNQPCGDGLKVVAIQTGLAVEVAAISDVGCRRPNNEDNFGYDLQSQLFVVCDGMGGMAAGEVASSAAVDQLLSSYESLGSAEMDIEQRLHRAIVTANRAVWATAQENEQLCGMGTTLVTACVDDSRVVIGNVGDSRAYFLRDGGCLQITQDHSFAAEHERLGVLPVAEGGLRSMRQLITRAVGVQAMVQPDLFTAEVKSGDLVLLATDGLTRYAEAEEIARQISGELSLVESCRKLVDIAKKQGAEDNVTCMLLRFQ